jgi:hypothetical protein
MLASSDQLISLQIGSMDIFSREVQYRHQFGAVKIGFPEMIHERRKMDARHDADRRATATANPTTTVKHFSLSLHY